jgi:RHS repeat-associated protein
MVEQRLPSGAESTWAYDAESHPTQLVTAGHVLQFGYDDSGRETFRQLDADVLLTTDIDEAGRPIGQTALSGVAGGPGSTEVRYLQTTERHPGGEPAWIADRTSGVRSVEQDPNGRVVAVHGGNGSEHYRYNGSGDITGAIWPGDEFEPAAGERTYDGTRLVRAGAVRYRYDEHGRTVSRSEPGENGGSRELRCSWDAEGRMTSVTTPAGERWRYRYDPFGRRIAKERLDSVDGGRERIVERIDFTWSGDHVVEELRSGADGVSRVTTWDRHPLDGRPLTQSIQEQARDSMTNARFAAVITDAIGTPSGLISSDGELVWQRSANLWGLDAPGTPAGMPLRMPGQYRDAETGLHYNHQRYYDPSIGRYLSPDPLGLEPAPNPVAYVRNPLMQADPLGLAPICPDILKQFPGADPGYITHVGLHSNTKTFSKWHVRESEHVMPMQAIVLAGLRPARANHENLEIAVSMPYKNHQTGTYGQGGGVSSTGGSKTAKDWAAHLGELLRNGQTYDAYRLVIMDEMNVSKHAAPGMIQYLDEMAKGTGTNGVSRLDDIEIQQLKQDVRDRWDELNRLDLPDSAYQYVPPPKKVTAPSTKVLGPSSSGGIRKKK